LYIFVSHFNAEEKGATKHETN